MAVEDKLDDLFQDVMRTEMMAKRARELFFQELVERVK